MVAHLGINAGRRRAAADHAIGVGLPHCRARGRETAFKVDQILPATAVRDGVQVLRQVPAAL
jgi:hypothetical protein